MDVDILATCRVVAADDDDGPLADDGQPDRAAVGEARTRA
jgi:hypothetical protein